MSTAREVMDGAMSEADWQSQVVDAARKAGWLTWHSYDSRRSYPGFPDLMMVRGPMLIALELKTEAGKVTVQQQEWIDALQKVRIVSADIARPHHWPDIERALTSKAR